MSEEATENEVAHPRAIELLEQQDSFAAIKFLESIGNPLEVTNAFSQTVMDLYWKKQNLEGFIAIARAGIQYALQASMVLGAEDEEAGTKLKKAARAISYNLSSFIWPGWDETVFKITDSEIQIGLDAARASLRLVEELDESDISRSRAHWLLAAQLLASGNQKEAEAEFQKSSECAATAEAAGEELLAEGFICICQLADTEQKYSAEQSLKDVLTKLETVEEGNFFAEQLETAKKVFFSE
jgi:hypothetical protein